MTTEQEKLKPCPFCGGSVKLEEVKMRSGTWYGVKCRNNRNLGGDCVMEQVPSRTPEAAVSRWNMRKPEDELRAEIDRLAADVVVGGKIIEERNRLLHAIPECAAHGPCVPYAIQWVQDARAQLAELLEELGNLKAENEVLRKDAERYRWLSQVSTMADKLSPGTVDHAMMLHQAMERVEIPDFTPGNGNNARRRAEELGIDYDAATSMQVKE